MQNSSKTDKHYIRNQLQIIKSSVDIIKTCDLSEEEIVDFIKIMEDAISNINKVLE